MQQPEDERIFEGAGGYLRHPETPLDALRKAYLRYADSRSGATIENVAKMLGHANTNMTRHYARILDSSIMRDMQSVAKSMAI